MLGVSASTLGTWERRLGYPQPRRTPGNHRQYELSEIEQSVIDMLARSDDEDEDEVEDEIDVRACRECGCTDEEACEGGCTWTSVNPQGWLCSACAAA